MRFVKLIAAFVIAASSIVPVYAQEGQPAAPSGASQGAAEGSSTAGKAAAKNEMKSHKKNRKAQKRMVNPHKNGM